MPQTSFKMLVEEYSKTVTNTAVRILHDSQTAEDVHEDVFPKILRRWHKFNGDVNWQDTSTGLPFERPSSLSGDPALSSWQSSLATRPRQTRGPTGGCGPKSSSGSSWRAWRGCRDARRRSSSWHESKDLNTAESPN